MWLCKTFSNSFIRIKYYYYSRLTCLRHLRALIFTRFVSLICYLCALLTGDIKGNFKTMDFKTKIYRLWRSYVNNENLSFNEYDVLIFILFVYTYILVFYSFNVYIYIYTYIYIYIYIIYKYSAFSLCTTF